MSKDLSKFINKLQTPISNTRLIYSVFITTLLIVPIILLINKYAYDKQGKLVCDDYVLNSYLYTALGFCYIALGVILEQRIKIIPSVAQYGGIALIIFMIVYVIIMYVLFKNIKETDPNKLININIYYALASIMFGIILSFTIILGSSTNVIMHAIAITIGLTFLMGYIGYKYGASFINVDFDKYLRYALYGLIIWTFIANLFIKDIALRFLSTSVPGAIIFCLLLMSYNKKLRENSEKCKVPNYPNEAIGLVIKIGNLLTDMIRILIALKVKGKRK